MQRYGTVALVLVPLGVGALFYMLMRPPGTLLDCWLSSAGLSLPRYHPSIPSALRAGIDWLPSAVWSFSLVAFVGGLNGPERGRGRTVWLAVATTLVVGWEIGQALGLLSGTFGWGDLFASLLAAVAAARCTGR